MRGEGGREGMRRMREERGGRKGRERMESKLVKLLLKQGVCIQ